MNGKHRPKNGLQKVLILKTQYYRPKTIHQSTSEMFLRHPGTPLTFSYTPTIIRYARKLSSSAMNRQLLLSNKRYALSSGAQWRVGGRSHTPPAHQRRRCSWWPSLMREVIVWRIEIIENKKYSVKS